MRTSLDSLGAEATLVCGPSFDECSPVICFLEPGSNAVQPLGEVAGLVMVLQPVRRSTAAGVRHSCCCAVVNSSASEHVEEVEQNDDGDRNAEYPEQ